MAGRSDERNLFNIDLFNSDGSEKLPVTLDVKKDQTRFAPESSALKVARSDLSTPRIPDDVNAIESESGKRIENLPQRIQNVPQRIQNHPLRTKQNGDGLPLKPTVSVNGDTIADDGVEVPSHQLLPCTVTSGPNGICVDIICNNGPAKAPPACTDGKSKSLQIKKDKELSTKQKKAVNAIVGRIAQVHNFGNSFNKKDKSLTSGQVVKEKKDCPPMVVNDQSNVGPCTDDVDESPKISPKTGGNSSLPLKADGIATLQSEAVEISLSKTVVVLPLQPKVVVITTSESNEEGISTSLSKADGNLALPVSKADSISTSVSDTNEDIALRSKGDEASVLPSMPSDAHGNLSPLVQSNEQTHLQTKADGNLPLSSKADGNAASVVKTDGISAQMCNKTNGSLCLPGAACGLTSPATHQILSQKVISGKRLGKGPPAKDRSIVYSMSEISARLTYSSDETAPTVSKETTQAGQETRDENVEMVEILSEASENCPEECDEIDTYLVEKADHTSTPDSKLIEQQNETRKESCVKEKAIDIDTSQTIVEGNCDAKVLESATADEGSYNPIDGDSDVIQKTKSVISIERNGIELESDINHNGRRMAGGESQTGGDSENEGIQMDAEISTDSGDREMEILDIDQVSNCDSLEMDLEIPEKPIATQTLSESVSHPGTTDSPVISLERDSLKFLPAAAAEGEAIFNQDTVVGIRYSVMTETGDKQWYYCNFCNKRCLSSEQLLKHMKQHENFKCNTCSFRTISLLYLMNHYIKIHKSSNSLDQFSVCTLRQDNANTHESEDKLFEDHRSVPEIKTEPVDTYECPTVEVASKSEKQPECTRDSEMDVFTEIMLKNIKRESLEYNQDRTFDQNLVHQDRLRPTRSQRTSKHSRIVRKKTVRRKGSNKAKKKGNVSQRRSTDRPCSSKNASESSQSALKYSHEKKRISWTLNSPMRHNYTRKPVSDKVFERNLQEALQLSLKDLESIGATSHDPSDLKESDVVAYNAPNEVPRKKRATQILSFDKDPERVNVSNEEADNFTVINEYQKPTLLPDRGTLHTSDATSINNQSIIPKSSEDGSTICKITSTADSVATTHTSTITHTSSQITHTSPVTSSPTVTSTFKISEKTKLVVATHNLLTDVPFHALQDKDLEKKSKAVNIFKCPLEQSGYSSNSALPGHNSFTMNTTGQQLSIIDGLKCAETCDDVRPGDSSSQSAPVCSSVPKRNIPYTVVMDDTIEELKEDPKNQRKSNRRRRKRKRLYLDSDEEEDPNLKEALQLSLKDLESNSTQSPVKENETKILDSKEPPDLCDVIQNKKRYDHKRRMSDHTSSSNIEVYMDKPSEYDNLNHHAHWNGDKPLEDNNLNHYTHWNDVKPLENTNQNYRPHWNDDALNNTNNRTDVEVPKYINLNGVTFNATLETNPQSFNHPLQCQNENNILVNNSAVIEGSITLDEQKLTLTGKADLDENDNDPNSKHTYKNIDSNRSPSLHVHSSPLSLVLKRGLSEDVSPKITISDNSPSYTTVLELNTDVTNILKVEKNFLTDTVIPKHNYQVSKDISFPNEQSSFEPSNRDMKCEPKAELSPAVLTFISVNNNQELRADKTFQNKREYKFLCKICKQQFPKRKDLQNHQTSEHGMKEELCHVCHICGKGFSRETWLHFHKKSHGIFDCKVCGESFDTLHKLKTHKQTLHKESTPFACKECGKTFSLKGALNVHLRKHSGERPYFCNICKATFTEHSTLKRHMITHSNDRPFKCNVCSATFSRENSLRIHSKIHTGIKPYACSICGKAFGQKVHMKAHESSHSNERPIKCHICGSGFKRREHLKNHMNRHYENQLFTCKDCGKGFKDFSSFSKHRDTHSTVKRFKCKICNAAFRLSSSLYYHKKTHLTEKPFKCTECGQGFLTSSNMKKHLMKAHPEANPFTCNMCNAFFPAKNLLKKHKLVHQGDSLFNCHICKLGFASNANFKAHCVIHNATETKDVGV